MAQVEEPKVAKALKARRESPRGEKCLNCGEETSMRFCPECGQENRPPELTLNAVLREFLAEVAYYDSKMWRTLRMLVTHPGRLSIEWSKGRRASFLSPVRLYLMVTFLFFLGTAWHGGMPSYTITVGQTPEEMEQQIQSLSKASLTPLMRQMAETQEPKLHLTPAQAKEFEQALDQGSKNYERAENAARIRAAGTSKLPFLLDPANWYGRQVNKLLVRTDLEAVGQEFIAQTPKVLFVILPAFAVVLRILYWRLKRTFVEHLVFILHLHSFAFLMLLPKLVIDTSWMSGLTALFVIFGLPAYAFAAMLRYYGQVWWLTLLKSWFLGFVYSVLLVVGAFIGLFLTAANLPDVPAARESVQSASAPPATSRPSPPVH